MGFLSDVVEAMFFRTDSMQYWHASLYGLGTVRGEIKNSERLKEHEAIAYEILLPRGSNFSNETPFVFFFHSAQFNMSYNMQQVAFLAEGGLPVVMFDYRGSGLSHGVLSLEGMLLDAELVWDEVCGGSVKKKNAILLGQGVGADALLRFYSRHEQDVAAVVLESVYATQRGWVRDRYGPVIGDICARLLRVTEIQPIDIISQVTCPLIVLRPEKDDFIRDGERRRFDEAVPKGAEIWHVKGRRYLGIFSDNASSYRVKLFSWLNQHKLTK
ncbi:alpha/beta hydrolase [uncultured Parasutterella sp.]|uniref:alpha/beta hydrolase n=1 Tax=uncultured Parasutterella sp. TaxID=1263098 RepID=UPI0025B5B370|nr:alpha/beta hydrolase [uncultured Parasutterella sp.]